eukprot:scaffold132816_cov17-Prasinocladus_malaysianus.AAC.1
MVGGKTPAMFNNDIITARNEHRHTYQLLLFSLSQAAPAGRNYPSPSDGTVYICSCERTMLSACCHITLLAKSYQPESGKERCCLFHSSRTQNLRPTDFFLSITPRRQLASSPISRPDSLVLVAGPAAVHDARRRGTVLSRKGRGGPV